MAPGMKIPSQSTAHRSGAQNRTLNQKKAQKKKTSDRAAAVWRALKLCTPIGAGPHTKMFTLRRAAKTVGVSRSTFSDLRAEYLLIPAADRPVTAAAYEAISRGAGRPTIFPPAFENLLAERLIHLAALGFPVTRARVNSSLIPLLHSNPSLQHPFNLFKGPGRRWWLRFMLDHPKLSEKLACRLSRSRSTGCNKAVIDGHFAALGNLSDPVSFLKILRELLEHMYNCDESQLHYDCDKLKALGETGKPLHRTSGSAQEREEHITGVFCIAAVGPPVPPLIIFKGVRKNQKMLAGAPADWQVDVTENGWITDVAYLGWFRELFLPDVQAKRAMLVAREWAALPHGGALCRRAQDAF